MTTAPTQLPIEYKGKQYSGIYSVSGNLIIARIPGISSASKELEDDEVSTAQALFNDILKEADNGGRL